MTAVAARGTVAGAGRRRDPCFEEPAYGPVSACLWRDQQAGRHDHRKQIWTLFTLATAARYTASG